MITIWYEEYLFIVNLDKQFIIFAGVSNFKWWLIVKTIF